LILSGVAARETRMRDRVTLEVLTHGDVVRPPAPGPDVLTALSPLHVLVLGGSFLHAAARWPTLLAAIHDRLDLQRRRLALQAAILQASRAEHRALLMLRHLAERIGHRVDDGTVMPLPLTHHQLGQLVAARRPTMTMALHHLEDEGLVRQLDDGGWLLTDVGLDRADALSATANGPALGELLRVRWRSEDVRCESEAVLRATRIRPRRP
jgi:hypothetical protein